MAWVTEHHPDRAGLSACVQCGLCLPVCPTFRLTGRETASPRGRLQAMTAVADGVMEVDAKFEEILDFCLGCRACEPVCPGMVPYGSLLEGSRAEIAAQVPSTGRRFRGWVLGRVVPSRRILGALTSVLRLFQRMGLVRLVPGRFRRSLSGLRRLQRPPIREFSDRGAPGTVGVLLGCVQEQWFSPVNTAAIELLTMAGHHLVIPEQQTCCGALAAHDGHAEVADVLGLRNEEAFGDCDVIVAAAAGCSAHLGDTYGERAEDITTTIARAIDDGLLPVLAPSGDAVVVQDPCHLRHAQRVTAAPRRIIQAAGFDVVEIDDDGMCCGAAGLYTVLQPEASATLGGQKADRIRAAGGTVVASANPGCEMQLRAFLGDDYEIRHPIELYLEAVKRSASGTNVAPVEMNS
ncbi:MAG: heterodisulfide reductase-related iron-sulfur binding cluster [Acidimicrobiia bacterium]